MFASVGRDFKGLMSKYKGTGVKNVPARSKSGRGVLSIFFLCFSRRRKQQE